MNINVINIYLDNCKDYRKDPSLEGLKEFNNECIHDLINDNILDYMRSYNIGYDIEYKIQDLIISGIRFNLNKILIGYSIVDADSYISYNWNVKNMIDNIIVEYNL